MTQPVLPGIAEKKRRVRKFKEDYVKENALQKVEIESLKNQLQQMQYEIDRLERQLFVERTISNLKKRSLFSKLFSRLFGGKNA